MLYKALGFMVWKAVRLFVRRRLGLGVGPGRRSALLAGGGAVAAIGAAAALKARSNGSSAS